MQSKFSVAAVAAVAVGLFGCGSSGSTTVVKQAAPPPQTTTVTEAAPAPKPKSAPAVQSAPAPQTTTQPSSGSVPDVVGEKLPEAQADLAAAGYHAKPRNTDTVFGIVIPSHYTVCKEDDPVGATVGVLAQKYGC